MFTPSVSADGPASKSGPSAESGNPQAPGPDAKTAAEPANPNRDDTDPKTLTVEEIAARKCLPSDFLRGLGLWDGSDGRIRIPYKSESGARLFARLRPGYGGRRFHQPRGFALRPYGLDRLAEARERGFLVIVEGESDSWAMWYHRVPTLGLPGADAAKTLRPEHLLGIRVLFIHREPGASGEVFVAGLQERLVHQGYSGEARVWKTPNYKDPADLHAALTQEGRADQFRDLIDQALGQAERLDLTPPPPKPKRLMSCTRVEQSDGHRRAYAEAALRGECRAVASAQKGGRNRQLNRSAFALGQLVAAGALSQSEVESALTEAARETGLSDPEIRGTLRSGLAAGKKEPRRIPARETHPLQPSAAGSTRRRRHPVKIIKLTVKGGS
jgi:hypothetical protein